jgi:aminoglycoside 2'-N-acetyltransferase I
MASVRSVSTNELGEDEVEALRELFREAWADHPEPFTDEDWDHALGGVHFLLHEAGHIVAHSSVVQRELWASGHRLATGYVEAVATAPNHQRRGYGAAVMREADEYIDRTFQLGALGTGHIAFFERLGWVVWRGPTFVRTETGLVRTAEEEGYVLVRLTPTSPELDLSSPIICDWRAGDVW